MVASVWFSRSILTFSFASTAWCRPSLQRRPGIRRPVNSSTITTLAVLDHVVDVEAEQRVRAQRLVRRGGAAACSPDRRGRSTGHETVREQLLGLRHAGFGQRHRLVLLVDDVVARRLERFAIFRP